MKRLTDEEFERHLNDPNFYHGDEPEEIISSFVALCGCGTGKPLALVYELLLWSAETDWDKRREQLPDGAYTSVAHEIAMMMLDHFELVEHGSSIMFAWATARGRMLLKKIEERRITPGIQLGYS